MKTLHRQTDIPLYDVATLHLIVCGDIVSHMNSRPDLFGEPDKNEEGTSYLGMCAYRGANLYLLFDRRGPITHDTLGHEIFHMTHRILEIVGTNFSTENHEPFAYLAGWMHAWVYRELKKARVKIS